MNSIIDKLKEGEDFDPQYRKIIGMLLEEMMLRDKSNGELYRVEMSKEMYMRYNAFFYTPEGKYKFNSLKLK